MSSDLRCRLDALLCEPVAHLGSGQTSERWLTLYGWARTGSVSLARLAEAHLDAIAIMAEAGVSPFPGAVYGVWASGGPADTVFFDPVDGVVSGHKPFSSGVGLIDRALVTGRGEAGDQWLVDADVSDLPPPPPWASPALVDTSTGDVDLGARSAQAVGDPGFYLERSGFWHGAIGPAACWAGAASGIVDRATQMLSEDPFRQAAQGALLAQQDLLETLLRSAGLRTDHGGLDTRGARSMAHTIRHLVDRSCSTIIDDFSQSFGPRPFVADADLAQRVLDTQLYCRQQHGAADLAALARSSL